MRQIKFRGKRISDGVWVVGFIVIQQDGTAWIGQAVRGRSAKGWQQVDPETVGQFTGYMDTENNPIYEGDYLLVTDEYGDHYVTCVFKESGAYVVEVKGMDYDQTAIGWAIDQWNNEGMGSNWRIVGNVHDGASLPKEVTICD
ncbi:MAG: YopX family protein [Thermoplasmatales archaeon]